MAFFHFYWDVPESGYEWVPVPEGKAKDVYLAERDPGLKSRGFRRYQPLKGQAAPFLTFVHTKPTKAAILKFANKYGALSASRITRSWQADDAGHIRTKFEGHSLESWQKEMGVMSDAVRLWNAVRQKDLDELKAAITWKDDRSVSFTGWDDSTKKFRRLSLIASEEHHPELFARLQPGDLKTPALFYIQQVINKNLAGRVSPRMLWDRDKLGLFYLPASLAGALWLQFSLAVTGLEESDFRRCGYCDNWFEISAKAARKSRLYCSDSCRVSAHRKKRVKK